MSNSKSESSEINPIDKNLGRIPKVNMITEIDLSQILTMCNSYERLPTILSYINSIEGSKWLRLLGEWWESFDNVSLYLYKILNDSPVASRTGPIKEMMDEEEINYLRQKFNCENLPLDVYRGCYRNVNENGICYSLSEEIAKKFPSLDRYSINGEQPIVRHSRVLEDDVIAFKNGCNELEIIARCFTVVSDTNIEM